MLYSSSGQRHVVTLLAQIFFLLRASRPLYPLGSYRSDSRTLLIRRFR